MAGFYVGIVKLLWGIIIWVFEIALLGFIVYYVYRAIYQYKYGEFKEDNLNYYVQRLENYVISLFVKVGN
jgi:hypothetical protein